MPETPKVPMRKAPPPLLQVSVAHAEALNPRTMRVRLSGDPLSEMEVPQPAASVRLLVPSEPGGELVIPEWNGNEFLLPDRERPALRTFTPLRFDKESGALDLEIVRHESGAVSSWVETCGEGDPAALSGPGSGWEPAADIAELLVFGDETAVPAIGQLLESVAALEPTPSSTVHIEVETAEAKRPVGPMSPDDVIWHVADPDVAPLSGVVAAAQAIESVTEHTHIWAAGEAAAVQALRKHFLKGLDVPRSRASIRGYWKSR
ncbi:MAG: siderophore-interacting protein [Microthrixaceae bacterium]